MAVNNNVKNGMQGAPEDTSVAGSFTAAVPHLDRPEVDERLNVLKNCPDLAETKAELDLIIGKLSEASNPLRGSSLYRDPSEFRALRDKFATCEDFDDSVINICINYPPNDNCYYKLLADCAVYGGIDIGGNELTGINGREGFMRMDDDDLGLDMSEVPMA